MLTIFRFEFYKIWCQKKLMCFILCLGAMQIFMFWSNCINASGWEKVDYREYKSLKQELAQKFGSEDEEKEKYIEKEIEQLERAENNAWKMTLYQRVQKEVSQAVHYKERLQAMLDGKGGSVLAEMMGSSFEVRDNRKMKKDFKNLEDVQPFFCGSYGLWLFGQYRAEDMLFVAVLAVLCFGLVEVEEDTEMLQYTLPGGRKRAGMVKFFFGAAATAFMVLLLYGAKLLLAGISYGLPGWKTCIQSVYGFGFCAWKITVLEYVLLFFGMKILAGFFIFSVLLWITKRCRAAWKAFVLISAGTAIFYIGYQGISSTSYLSCFKWVNPATVFDIASLFSDYHNLDILGYPVRYISFALIFSALLAFFFFVLCLLRREKSIAQHEKTAHKNLFRIPFGSFFGELYKSWVCSRVAWLYLLLFLFSYLAIPAEKENLREMDDVYYRSYVKGVEGEYTAGKYQDLLKEWKSLEKIEKEKLSEGLSDAAYQIYLGEIQKKAALEKVIAYGRYLGDTDKGEFIYYAGYEKMLGKSKDNHILFCHQLLAVLLMIAASASVWGIEIWSGMEQISVITKSGRKKMRCGKYKNLLLCSILAAASVFGLYLYRAGQEYGWAGILAPANSIPQFQNIPSGICVLGVLCAYYLLWVIYLWLAGCLVEWVNRWFKGYLMTAAVSFVLFVMPVLVHSL